MPKSVNKGKTVLIASSENAIRGLLMHLCNIPEDRISEVEIPTGLPLIYSFKSKSIRLLEDGSESEEEPLGNYNFGTSPELLFNPCPEDLEEMEDTDLECFFGADGKSYKYDPLVRLNRAATDWPFARTGKSQEHNAELVNETEIVESLESSQL